MEKFVVYFKSDMKKCKIHATNGHRNFRKIVTFYPLITSKNMIFHRTNTFYDKTNFDNIIMSTLLEICKNYVYFGWFFVVCFVAMQRFHGIKQIFACLFKK